MNPAEITQEDILQEIRNERAVQDRKWGAQRGLEDVEWLPILIEEVGEVGTAILHSDTEELEDELVQVAAVAVCWLESIAERVRC